MLTLVLELQDERFDLAFSSVVFASFDLILAVEPSLKHLGYRAYFQSAIEPFLVVNY